MSKTIYEMLMEANKDDVVVSVKNGCYIRVGKQKLVERGVLCTDLKPLEYDGDPMDEIKRLYKEYKRSVPNKKQRRNPTFKACDKSELTFEELIKNVDREVARQRLEAFVMLAGLDGLLVFGDKYFIQDEEDRDLVILKEWFKNN
mgnify:CR=1 FL=1